MTLRELADFVPFPGVASLETGQRSTSVAKDNNRQRTARGLDIAKFTVVGRILGTNDRDRFRGTNQHRRVERRGCRQFGADIDASCVSLFYRSCSQSSRSDLVYSLGALNLDRQDNSQRKRC